MPSNYAKPPIADAPSPPAHKSALQNNTAASTQALTEWLNGGVQPAYEGVYERRAPAGPFSCFSGDRWFGDATTPATAALGRAASPHQHAGWRGLTAPLHAPCGTCRGHTVVDRGVDAERGTDLIEECPDC